MTFFYFSGISSTVALVIGTFSSFETTLSSSNLISAYFTKPLGSKFKLDNESNL